jgi:branched-chain amino acid transport system ATP-binding protein
VTARLGFSMVPEGRQVFGELTVEENLRLGAGIRPDRAAAARDLENLYEVFPMLRDRREAPGRAFFRAGSSRCW